MKRLLGLFWLSFLLVACGEQSSDSKIVIGTSADYPPFEFYQDGEIVGFEVDLMRMIANHLKKTLVIQDLPFESLIAALQSKRIDLGISAFSKTPERLEKVDFSIPYHQSYTVLIVKKDSAIQSFQDLSNKTVGVQQGSSYETLIQQHWKTQVPNLQLRSLSKIPDLLQDFHSGRIQALVVGNTEGSNLVAKNPDFKIIPIAGTEVSYAIAFPKGSPLVEPVNKLLKQWIGDGTLKKAEQAWMSGKKNIVANHKD